MWDTLRMKAEHLLWEAHYWAAGATVKRIGWFLVLFVGFFFPNTTSSENYWAVEIQRM